MSIFSAAPPIALQVILATQRQIAANPAQSASIAFASKYLVK